VEIVYSLKAEEQLLYFVATNNRPIYDKIKTLIDNIQQTPYRGIGKPEALKHGLSGLWSRRISQEHRLVYEVFEDRIFIHSLKGHYS
jgi:toxin YoeB